MNSRSQAIQTEAFLFPSCDKKAVHVPLVTLQYLLKSDALSRLEEGPYRFCESQDCDVVYCAENGGETFTKKDLTVRVGVKETEAPRLVCYCFNHTVEEIEEEVRRTGKSSVLDDIKSRMKKACWCETKSPRGSCCLGTVNRFVKQAMSRHGKVAQTNESKVAEEPGEDCWAVHNQKVGDTAESKPGGDSALGWNAEKLSQGGAVLSAIVASACCWLPLLLLASGVSGVAVSATFEQYRPLFTVLTFGFLGAAFYFTYRPRRSNVVQASRLPVCRGVPGGMLSTEACFTLATSTEPAVPTGSLGESRHNKQSCCPPEGMKGFNLKKLNKVMLWVVTALALAFVFFPNYVGALIGGAPSLASRSDLDKVTLKVGGMTCEGCASNLQESLAKVPGVAGAEVNYEKGQAIVGVPKGKPVPREAILAAVSKAGFKGSFQETVQKRVTIEGMTCEGCAAHIQAELAKLQGVSSAVVIYKNSDALVTLQNDGPSDEAIKEAIESAGYKVREITLGTAGKK